MVAPDDDEPQARGWRDRAKAFLTDVFVVEDPDFVREDSIDVASVTPSNESRPVFAWGGEDGDEALRLPRGVAAAERLAAGRDDAATPKASLRPPALREDQIRDAKKEPLALAAVLVIIVFQLVGSLIGLTRELVPMEYQGAAIMEEVAIDQTRASE